MKITLVNGSPRRNNASSRLILDTLATFWGEGHSCRHLEAYPEGNEEVEDFDADLIVLAFPLYVDSLPSGLLSWLIKVQPLMLAARSARISRGDGGQKFSAVANCGFHEGKQNKSALDILYNFSISTGLQWSGGLGIGTGEMIRELKGAPPLMFIKRPVTLALGELAGKILSDSVAGSGSVFEARDGHPVHAYACHAFPRFLYMMAGHAGWKSKARENGLKVKQIRERPLMDTKQQESKPMPKPRIGSGAAPFRTGRQVSPDQDRGGCRTAGPGFQ